MSTDWLQAAKAEHFVIRTSRLLIRPLATQDQQLYLSLYTDPGCMRFITDAFPEDKALNSFEIALRLNARHPFKRLFLAIMEQEQAVGLCAISQLNYQSAEIELGIMLKRRWHTKGYAAEALHAFVQQVQQQFSGASIWADINPQNKAAIQLALKTGFVADPLDARTYRIPG